MKAYLNYLKGDRVIWIITLLMLAFSLVSVYSFVPILVKIEGGTPFKYLFKHLIYVVIGFAVMYWIHRRDSKYINQISTFGFYVAIGLLIFTFFFGAKVNDAGRWIRIPFVGLTFQSSDFAKVAIILYLSKMLVRKKDMLDKWKGGFGPVLWPVVIISALIFKDNFSTSALIFMICLILMFIGNVPFTKLLSILVAGVTMALLAIALQKAVPELNILPRLQTWENRIFNKLEGNQDLQSNAQSNNAKLAIFNGSVFGKGVGDGQLKEYLPEAYADFYFASFVEEFGIVSAIFLMLLYLILLFRIIRIGLRSESLFETYASLGIGILLLTQASVNMLVCTGVFPVTGQNMPLLAMGGSALIMTCVSIGIIQSFAYKQEKQKETKLTNEIA
jgi:cell division protein FtsW